MIFAVTDILNNFSTLANIIMVLAVLVGGTYIAKIRLQAGKQSTDKELLRESYDDLQKVHYADQLIINQLRKEVEVLKQANSILEKNYKTLEDIKTQAPSILKMMKQSGDQHREIMGAFATMTSQIGKELSNVANALIRENRQEEGRRAKK